MQADFKLSEKFSVQDTELITKEELLLTDIVLPQNYSYRISSSPVKKKYNRLFSGDNLCLMNKLIDEGYENTFDLIYIDPPYLSQGNYSHSVHMPGKSKTKILKNSAYSDTWKSIDEYLLMLYPRLVLMHRLLSPTGSFFVHLDWHVSHYVKILLDEIFGFENFRNEIVWCYYGPSSPLTRQFNREHQNIFWYSKSPKKWQFFPDEVRIPYKASTLQKIGSKKNGFSGALHDFTPGKIPEDWWSDIPLAQRFRYEVANFETQKPKKLLERIIKSTTKKGDLVGDFFAGSGTTPVVAEELDRNWISADSSSLSLKITKSRLSPVLKKPFLVEKLSDKKIPKVNKRSASLSRKRVKNKTLSVTLHDYSLSTKKLRKIPKKTLSSSLHFIDSWAVDWNYDGNVFRAVWGDFRGSGKNVTGIEKNKERTFRRTIPKKIGIKVVDVFGNEQLRSFSF